MTVKGSRASGSLRIVLVVWLGLVLVPIAAAAAVAQQGSSQPAQQDEFVPVDRLPSQEELPATPLLTTAYAVAWLAILAYLWSIWQRIGRVEREISEVTRRVQQRLAAPEPRRMDGADGTGAPEPRTGGGGG